VGAWLVFLVLTIAMVVLVLGWVIATVFFSITKLTTEIPTYTQSARNKPPRNLHRIQRRKQPPNQLR